MSKILFLNETDRNASYKTEYRYKTAKPVKAVKPKRDEAGFIVPYAMFRPIREPGLICELLGDTPVRRSADLKMNLDYLMKEAYGVSYAPAASPLRIITWYTAFSYLGIARNAWVVSYQKQNYLKYLYVGSALTNVILNALLIPVMGASGAALASLVTQMSTILVFPALIKGLRPNVKLMIDAIRLKI